MRRHPRPAALSGICVLLGSAGCCDFAGLLCGPDRSQWVPISYETPDAALATFMEAIRRDAAKVIAESLSGRFKLHHGLGGVLETAILWEKIKEEVSGVHLLGTATVQRLPPEPGAEDGKVSYVLEKRGYRVRVDLARYAYWGVHYELDGERDFREAYFRNPGGAYVDQLSDYVALERGEDEAGVLLRLEGVDLPDSVDVGDVRKVVAGTEWRIDDLVPLDEEDADDPNDS